MEDPRRRLRELLRPPPGAEVRQAIGRFLTTERDPRVQAPEVYEDGLPSIRPAPSSLADRVLERLPEGVERGARQAARSFDRGPIGTAMRMVRESDPSELVADAAGGPLIRGGRAAREIGPSVRAAMTRRPGADVYSSGDIIPYSRLDLEEAAIVPRGASSARRNLPMDAESRMQRMVEQGYDPSDVMFHSSRKGEFDVIKLEDRPMWITPNARQSETYLENDFVLPVVSRPGKNLSIDAGGKSWDELNLNMVGRALREARLAGGEEVIPSVARAVNEKYPGRAQEIFDEIFSGYGGRAPTGRERPITTDEIAGLLRKSGFDSADFRRIGDFDADNFARVYGDYLPDWQKERVIEEMTSRVLFDPSRVRHIDANFDPKRISDKDMLAGLALPAIFTGGAVANQRRKRED